MSRPVFWWARASAGLMVVGGLAPWASVFDAVTINGTDGDGWFLIIGGGIAGALLIIRFVTASTRIWFVIVSLIVALLCALVAAVDLGDVAGLAGEGADVSELVDAKWGLYLSLLASLSLGAASIALLVTGRAEQRIDPAATAYTPPGTAHLPPAPAGAAPAGAATPAAWYPDPKGQKRLRYWDGAAWTEHTAD